MAWPALAAAQLPVGSEFQVNTFTTDGQFLSDVAPDGADGFVVTWASLGSSGDDGLSYSVQGRLYDGEGSPAGAEFQVNTYTIGSQYAPVVESDDAGGFMIVWQSVGSSESDIDGRSIQARLFASDGSPQGDQFQVNTYTAGHQYNPAIGPDGDGGFVVAWQSEGSSGSDTSYLSVQAQRFGPDGTPAGGQFQVNSFTPEDQYLAAVSGDGDSGFVISWTSFGSAGGDVSLGSIQAQRYESDGSPAGGQFQVNSYTTGVQVVPTATSDGAGGFVVAWMSQGSNGDTSGFSVQAQHYASDGTPLAGEFQVNTYTSSDQAFPNASLDAGGGFVVTWSSYGSSGNDSSLQSIQGQRYDSDGSPFGTEFQINTYTTNDQYLSRVSPYGDQGFVVTWSSLGSNGTDTSDLSVQAQPFVAELFADGFESGDTSAWDSTVPLVEQSDGR